MPLRAGQDPISGVTRHMAILAVLIGCQGIDAFRAMVPAVMEFGVTPVQIKEIVCQAGLAIHGAEAANAERAVRAWARRNLV